MVPELSLSPKSTLRLLLVAITIIILLGIAAELVARAPWYGQLPGDKTAVRLLDLNGEGNIPAWLSSSLLLLSSLLAGLIALIKRASGDRWLCHWVALSFIFLGLSADEIVQFHEQLVWMLQPWVDNRGILFYRWVAVGLIFVTGFVLTYARFFISLPPRTRVRLLLAGASYVGGALGLEMVGGAYVDSHGHDLWSTVISLTEESLELVGVVLFIYALLAYMGWCTDGLHVRFKDEPATRGKTPQTDEGTG